MVPTPQYPEGRGSSPGPPHRKRTSALHIRHTVAPAWHALSRSRARSRGLRAKHVFWPHEAVKLLAAEQL